MLAGLFPHPAEGCEEPLVSRDDAADDGHNEERQARAEGADARDQFADAHDADDAAGQVGHLAAGGEHEVLNARDGHRDHHEADEAHQGVLEAAHGRGHEAKAQEHDERPRAIARELEEVVRDDRAERAAPVGDGVIRRVDEVAGRIGGVEADQRSEDKGPAGEEDEQGEAAGDDSAVSVASFGLGR